MSTGVGYKLGWHVRLQLDKYQGSAPPEKQPALTPYETVKWEGNLVMNGGADVLWKRLITKNPTTAAAGVLSAFSTLAALGVGASSGSSGTQTLTDLVSTSKVRKIMDSAFPAHTTGTSTSARSCQFKATFSTAQANFAWKEWGLFNSTASGRMLSRKTQALGTKTSAATWALTVTYTLS